MKKILVSILSFCVVVASALAFVGCNPSTCNVTFYYNCTSGGQTSSTKQVESGTIVTAPELEERAGLILDGWYLDNGTFKNEFVLKNKPITQNTNLYAKWATKCVVTFHANCTMFFIEDYTLTREVASGRCVKEFIWERGNYVLDGYFYDNGTWQQPYNWSDVITQDTDVYAKWSYDRTKLEAFLAQMDKNQSERGTNYNSVSYTNSTTDTPVPVTNQAITDDKIVVDAKEGTREVYVRYTRQLFESFLTDCIIGEHSSFIIKPDGSLSASIYYTQNNVKYVVNLSMNNQNYVTKTSLLHDDDLFEPVYYIKGCTYSNN